MSEEVHGAALARTGSDNAAREELAHHDQPSDSGEARAERAGLEALEREFKDLLRR